MREFLYVVLETRIFSFAAILRKLSGPLLGLPDDRPDSRFFHDLVVGAEPECIVKVISDVGALVGRLVPDAFHCQQFH